jgi:hypothetical protein
MEKEDGTDPQGVLFDIVGHVLQAQILRAFVELRIADRLAGGPLDLESLATSADADAPTLRRFLRAARGIGLCAIDDDERYSLMPVGAMLRDVGDGSMADWVLLMTAPWLVRPWEQLSTAVRTGRSVFENVHGTGFWRYVADHPDDGAVFDGAMTSGAAHRGGQLASVLEWDGVTTVVDVGGGQGLLLAALLQKVPGLRGVAADRPEVLEGASAVLAGSGVEDRIGLVACDFFSEVPQGGDVYILSRILHDWADQPAKRILTATREAMSPGARVLLVEQVVPEADDLPPDEEVDLAVKDLNMLVLVGGQERTASEYGRLLDSAGFVRMRVLEADGLHVIEATAA